MFNEYGGTRANGFLLLTLIASLVLVLETSFGFKVPYSFHLNFNFNCNWELYDCVGKYDEI